MASYAQLPLRKVQHLEQDNVILIEEMKPRLGQVHLARGQQSRYLHVVEVALQELESYNLLLMQENDDIVEEP